MGIYCRPLSLLQLFTSNRIISSLSFVIMTTSLNFDINVYTVIYGVLCTLFATSMLPPESRDLKTMDEFKQNYHPASNLNVSYILW